MAEDLATLLGLHGLTEQEVRAAVRDLCARGLLTCTCGEPGEDGATYALAWLPLDDPESYPPEVRERHAENMRRFAGETGGA